MTLQTQGVLRLGVEDHLASSRTNGESRSIRPLPHIFQKPAEIFEAHLLMALDAASPMPPFVALLSFNSRRTLSHYSAGIQP